MIHLQAELFEGLDEPARLRGALQTALELEHATIPPYLVAAYSLLAVNRDIKNLIRDVAREEMLHMSLVANMLNAVGGRPTFTNPTFVPSYPTSLPGTVQSSLIVPLAAFSPTLVESVFLTIEEPEIPQEFPVVAAAAEEKRTIGQFYAQIKQVFLDNGAALFVGDPALQVAIEIDDDESFVVTDVDSAVRAIELIVAQGEGTAASPLEKLNDEPAHYYRFTEILKARKLQADSSVPEKFSYSGDKIAFDPAGVLPVKPNVKINDFPIDTAARQLAEQFNRDYVTMLRELERAFHGEPDRLNVATNLMKLDLPKLARQLMTTEIAPGVNGGPTFEYVTL